VPTVVFVAAVLGSGFALGLPLLWLSRRDQALTESDWLLAPFLGLSTYLLVLHNLLYADITVAQCTPWIWATTTIMWLGLLLTYGLKPIWTNCPTRLLLAMAAVYGIQGLGLLAVGVNTYMGRASCDQFNYTTVAQLLCDCPLSVSWDAIGQRPYLVDALRLKTNERIGGSVLQGFLASSLGTDAKQLFGPTILLGPALVVLAIYSLARKLGFRPSRARVTASIAGILPGLTILQLDCFLAQVLAVPVTIFLFTVLLDMVIAPSVRSILHAGILLAATTALYTEFVPILLLLALAFCVGGVVVRGTRPSSLGLARLAVPGLMIALNPLYCPTIVRVMRRTAFATAGSNPMGFSWLSGFSAIWINVAGLVEESWSSRAAVAVGFALAVLAIVGLCRLAWLGFTDDSADRRSVGQRGPKILLRLAVIGFVLVPAAVLPSIDQHPYQFIKLLLTVAPMLVVGLAALRSRPPGAATRLDRPQTMSLPILWLRYAMGWPLLASVALMAMWSSVSMVLGTLSGDRGTPAYVNWLRDPNRLETIEMLEKLHDQPVVLACGPGLFNNSWLAYAARRNPVWLVSPVTANNFVVGFESAPIKGLRPLPVAKQLVDLQNVPPGALLLTLVKNDQVAVDGMSRLVWENAHFRLWQLGPGPVELRPLLAALRP
jgi:hypothetical protein